MPRPGNPADRRDARAVDRDDTAGRRDDVTGDRDDDAIRRDVDAVERDDDARDDAEVLADRLGQIRRQVLDRFARIENATVDPRDWPDLPPAALARLAAHTAEQRRLAGLDREAVTALFDQLDHGLSRLGQDRHAAAHDRDASARDRRHSAGDRSDSGRDRDLSARDRGQAAVEREQVDPGVLPPDDDPPGPRRAPREPVTFAERVAASRRRLSDSRDRLDGTGRHAADTTDPEY